MGKYALNRFYEEHDLEFPREPGGGDCYWSVLEGGKEGEVWCLNPSNWGNQRMKIQSHPRSIGGTPVLDEYNWLHPDLEDEPVYLKIDKIRRGRIFARIPPEDEWPDPTEDEDIFPKPNHTDSQEWEGTEQSVSTDGDTSHIIHTDELRGSKNDLLK